MSKAFNIQNAISKAAKTTNLNEARTSGGDGGYTPPAAGVPGLRFVSYVEVGPQEKTFEGKTSLRPIAILTFELHGKRWPLSENGLPQRLNVKLTAPGVGQQPHVKSTYYKLFKAMNYEGKFNHFAEMLGQDYVGTVYHKQDAKDPKKVYPQFVDPVLGGAPNIRAPFVEDEDGEPQRRKVPDAINELRLFLWAAPDMDQWASIFIDGTYDDGRSKNVYQNQIKASPEFEGSMAEAMLMGLDEQGQDDPAAAKAAAKARAKEKAAEKAEAAPEETSTEAADTPQPKKTPAKRAPAKKAEVAAEPAESDEDDPLADIDAE